ncbi:uncharacterized protein PHACADRAFT_258626 [Phanerochaete carnosa HHB-10118-sp]|uniref:SHSP domain-containing protein n=1 Tax=Phanerochaete carnosa (strain HHB-10118-sp) TaxID=650164 RepID=K5W6Q0_PHACS|nr:uncharacterized protein PHACADRAFT_258626 [Phanerochaete carnosa HHB-10118-sp]EKM54634.1 hypothetical protein PHACADRAFT_258626 [Phanerochaete carnosa HHB-10118-sp]
MPSEIHDVSHSPSSSCILTHDGAEDASSPTKGAPSEITSSPPSPSASIVIEQQRSQSQSPSEDSMDTSDDMPSPPVPARIESRAPERHQHHQYRRSMASPVQLYGRPLSASDTPSPTQIYSPRPVRAAPPPDPNTRGSTQSLPLPMNTPYHTLPSIQGSSTGTALEGEQASKPPSTSSISPRTYPQASTSRRPAYMVQEVVPRADPPDWLREYSESRRNLSPSSVDGRAILQPQPPTVLTPPPPLQGGAPHESFLSHAPPPQDSYIAVETGPTDYHLLVRLPGYVRDSMCVLCFT